MANWVRHESTAKVGHSVRTHSGGADDTTAGDGREGRRGRVGVGYDNHGGAVWIDREAGMHEG